MGHDLMHLARLAALEGALLALLREAAENPFGDEPLADEITATLSPEGLDIAYLRHGNPVSGEGV